MAYGLVKGETKRRYDNHIEGLYKTLKMGSRLFDTYK